MIVTKSWIENNYNKYNNLYFGGVLPKIEFKISRSKKTWGQADYIYNRFTNNLPLFLLVFQIILILLKK